MSGVRNRRNMYRKTLEFDHSYVTANVAEQYDTVRKQLPPFKQRDRPSQVSRGRGRQSYQNSREEKFRQQKSANTSFDLSESLRKKLLPDVKDSESAIDRHEAVATLKAITIFVTTRAIGFGTAHLFSILFEFNNVPVNGIYQMYRVVFEAKIEIAQRGINYTMQISDCQSTN
ncbi:unnamed protein product [Brassicogethes aeneus]|uniref:Uncharacterized protein n=1 Tax=Brassicogethes aeneus TaxID=1431903 RepID=A0A9P0BGQ3_BRAAE|nr:unnamed protein product [Brassicogethes aeneus]